ncbi:MAG: hypothetical protein PHE55_06825 [Methylococcaceae bacterium]|nr:hypothetical protein [Methylococcaceae bacterium]
MIVIKLLPARLQGMAVRGREIISKSGGDFQSKLLDGPYDRNSTPLLKTLATTSNDDAILKDIFHQWLSHKHGSSLVHMNHVVRKSTPPSGTGIRFCSDQRTAFGKNNPSEPYD